MASRPQASQSKDHLGIEFQTVEEVELGDIRERAPWFYFKVGPVPPQNPHIQSLGPSATYKKRWGTAFNIERKFPSNTISFGYGPYAISFACKDCGSKGRVLLSIEWKFGLTPHIPHFAVETTDGVSFWAYINVAYWFDLDKPKWFPEETKNLAKYPLQGFHIPKVLTLGAFLQVDAILALNAPTVSAGIDLVSGLL